MNVTIRLMAAHEAHKMAPLARDFFEENDILPGGILPERYTVLWETLIEQGVGFVVGAFDDDRFVGGIGAFLVPSMHDGELEAIERFWFMDARYRGAGTGERLLEEFEGACKDAEARRIIMTHLYNDLGQKLGKVFEKRGYHPFEVNYAKEI